MDGAVDEKAVIDGLGGSRLFARLDPAKLGKIHGKGRVRELAPGESLVDELAPNSDLFVVLQGTLEVCLPHTAERFTKLVVDTIGPGDCIGEYSFIDKQPASASVVALEPAKVFAIAHDAFEEVLRSDSVVGHAVYENLLRLLIERLRRELASLDLFRPTS